MERKEDLGDKKWNNLQNDRLDHKEFNEGFSSENISKDYNPARDAKENFRIEAEKDTDGDTDIVERARYIDGDSADIASPVAIDIDNKVIENEDSLENRDRNYDIDPNRFPPSHPENHINRGNLEEE